MPPSAVVFHPGRLATQLNTCPKCLGPMVLTQIKSSRTGYETRTFQGVNCDHVYKLETATDSMKWAPSGLGARFGNREIQKASNTD